MSSQADRERIADAIRRGGEYAGEIFCVPARHASDYRLVPLAWAAVITLVVPAPLIYLTSLAASVTYLIESRRLHGRATWHSLSHVRRRTQQANLRDGTYSTQ